MYENDPRVTLNRLVESWSRGHGRIVSISDYFCFRVQFEWGEAVLYPMHENGLKFFNDEETDYLPLT